MMRNNEVSQVTLTYDSFLNVLLAEQFYKPYSCQRFLQLHLTLDQYAEFVRYMVDSSSTALYSAVSTSVYNEALNLYASGKPMKLQYLFTTELYNTCLSELKRALARNMDATVIVLNYVESELEVEYESISSLLPTLLQKDNYRKSLPAVFKKLQRGGIGLIKDSTISKHNSQYYFYLVFLELQYEVTKYTGVFEPVNVRRGHG